MPRLGFISKVAAPLALLALGGCAQTFSAKVNRFQAMPAPQGETFAIKADDPKLAGSLEFSQYASLVSQKMTALGYQPAANAANASLIVSVDYGVDEGKERTRLSPSFGYSGYGYGGYGGFGYGRYAAFDPYFSPYRGYYGRHGYNFAFGYNDPFLFGSGYNEVEQYTVFTSGLKMNIARQGGGQRLFEGKAEAMSLNNNLTYLVPNLVEAMFTGFPGNSGETVKITVQQPKKR